jgi:hypothetical protein
MPTERFLGRLEWLGRLSHGRLSLRGRDGARIWNGRLARSDLLERGRATL